MKISDSKSRTVFLEEFDTVLEKFGKVSADKIPAYQKIGLFKKAVNADDQLLQAWTAMKTIISHGSASGTVTIYGKYLEYLISHSEKLEESSIDNSGCKVNIADIHFMESYLHEDSYYNEAFNVITNSLT